MVTNGLYGAHAVKTIGPHRPAHVLAVAATVPAMAHSPAHPCLLHRQRQALAVAASLLLLAASCSSGSTTSSSAPTSSAAAPTTAAPSSEPEAYTGSDADFYKVPSPLTKGAPGQLIRVQKLDTLGTAHVVRVMYHSRDGEQRDRAVTGIISYPTAKAPQGGWPVTSQANGTVGLAQQCALSRLGQTPPDYGVEGVHAVTDYVGLGPVGEIHPYLSGPSEGNSVIDAVRAARNLPDAHASTRWFSIGHSQGGHGALFGGERAATYGKDLHLLGTVSFAPATELTKTYGPLDEIVARIVGVMMLYGASSEHPKIHFDDYAGPKLKAVEGVFRTGCLNEITNAMLTVPAEGFYAHDPLTTEPAKSLLKQNQPGLIATPTPLFLAQGTKDERVNVQRTRDFFAQVCTLGQVTDFVVIDGADHGAIVGDALPQATAWMQARLKDDPPPDSCP